MTLFRETRAALYLLILLIGSSVTLLSPGHLAAQTPMPDVLIWIDARAADTHWISITYPKVVEKAQAEKHLLELLKETGWNAANTNITNTSIMASGENPMTSVEFTAPNAVNAPSGVLPIEPIVKAFRDLKIIEIQYLAPPGFQFQGLEDYENKYVSIAFARGAGTFKYSIRVKDPNFDTLGLPTYSAQQNGIFGHDKSYMVWIVTALAIIAALMVGFLAYLITGKLIAEKRRPNRRS